MSRTLQPDPDGLIAFLAVAEAIVEHELRVAAAWRTAGGLDDIRAAHRGRRRLLEDLARQRPAAQADLSARGNPPLLADPATSDLLARCGDLQRWDGRLWEATATAEETGATPEQWAAALAYHRERAEAILEEAKLPALLERLHLLRGQAGRPAPTAAVSAGPAQPEGGWSAPRTVAQWARTYGIHRNTMRCWLRDRRIQAEPIGGLWRVALAALPAEPSRRG
jgi:hypothetical protein